MRTLLDEHQRARSHTMHWDGLDERGQRVVSGVYVCRLIAGEFVQTIKMLLVQ